MLVRRFSVVNFDIDSSDGGHGAEGKEVEYLPMPRTKHNPNARGGAIAVHPVAPTERLDYYKKSKKLPKMDLYDLMIDLGIIKAP